MAHCVTTVVLSEEWRERLRETQKRGTMNCIKRPFEAERQNTYLSSASLTSTQCNYCSSVGSGFKSWIWSPHLQITSAWSDIKSERTAVVGSGSAECIYISHISVSNLPFGMKTLNCLGTSCETGSVFGCICCLSVSKIAYKLDGFQPITFRFG